MPCSETRHAGTGSTHQATACVSGARTPASAWGDVSQCRGDVSQCRGDARSSGASEGLQVWVGTCGLLRPEGPGRPGGGAARERPRAGAAACQPGGSGHCPPRRSCHHHGCCTCARSYWTLACAREDIPSTCTSWVAKAGTWHWATSQKPTAMWGHRLGLLCVHLVHAAMAAALWRGTTAAGEREATAETERAPWLAGSASVSSTGWTPPSQTCPHFTDGNVGLLTTEGWRGIHVVSTEHAHSVATGRCDSCSSAPILQRKTRRLRAAQCHRAPEWHS